MTAITVKELAQCTQTLTAEMLTLAATGDWEGVAALEAERQGVIEALFESPLPADHLALVETCLREVVAANAAVLALGQDRREQLSERLQALATGRKAVDAYAEAGR